MKSLRERFEDKFIPEPMSGCWLWLRALDQKGYGFFWFGNRMHRAHRVSYEMNVGPIPSGLVLDHKCRNTACVNPDHLEPVTTGENTRRGIVGLAQASRTHCPHGHEYNAENTRVYPQSSGRGYMRKCMPCHVARRIAKAG